MIVIIGVEEVNDMFFRILHYVIQFVNRYFILVLRHYSITLSNALRKYSSSCANNSRSSSDMVAVSSLDRVR